MGEVVSTFVEQQMGMLMEGMLITLKASIMAILAIPELTKAIREAVTTSLMPYELWFVCGILYLIPPFTLSMFFQYLEKRSVPPALLHRPRAQTDQTLPEPNPVTDNKSVVI